MGSLEVSLCGSKWRIMCTVINFVNAWLGKTDISVCFILQRVLLTKETGRHMVPNGIIVRTNCFTLFSFIFLKVLFYSDPFSLLWFQHLPLSKQLMVTGPLMGTCTTLFQTMPLFLQQLGGPGCSWTSSSNGILDHWIYKQEMLEVNQNSGVEFQTLK